MKKEECVEHEFNIIEEETISDDCFFITIKCSLCEEEFSGSVNRK